MAGIIMVDLNGGDSAITVVDDALFGQIQDVFNNGACDGSTQGIILWLSSPAREKDVRPKTAPDPKGEVLRTYYTQTWSTEAVDFNGVKAMITLPGG